MKWNFYHNWKICALVIKLLWSLSFDNCDAIAISYAKLAEILSVFSISNQILSCSCKSIYIYTSL